MLKPFLNAVLKRVFASRKKRNREVKRYVSGETTIKGLHFFYPDKPSFDFTYQEIFEKKIYDFDCKNRKPFIIDCGANIGLASLYFKLKYPSASIIALEPDGNLSEYFYKNFRSNNISLSDVQLQSLALWKHAEGVVFYPEGADAGVVSATGSGKLEEQVNVQSITLAEIVGSSRVDFLKMDIEGAESTVFPNLNSDLLKQVDRIFIEYHSFENRKQDLGGIIGKLEKNGFRYHINAPGISSSQPFIKVNSYLSMDMQLNIYAWRQEN